MNEIKLYDISDWCKLGHEPHDYPYIGESNQSLEIGIVLEINGAHFIPGIIDPLNDEAGVHPCHINIAPDAYEYEHNIVCPYCGYIDCDSWERADNEDTIECGRCGALIQYERIVTVDYTTSPVKPPKIIQAQWV